MRQLPIGREAPRWKSAPPDAGRAARDTSGAAMNVPNHQAYDCVVSLSLCPATRPMPPCKRCRKYRRSVGARKQCNDGAREMGMPRTCAPLPSFCSTSYLSVKHPFRGARGAAPVSGAMREVRRGCCVGASELWASNRMVPVQRRVGQSIVAFYVGVPFRAFSRSIAPELCGSANLSD